MSQIQAHHNNGADQERDDFRMEVLEVHLCHRTNDHFADDQGLDYAETHQNNAVVLLVHLQIEPYVFHNQDEDECEVLADRFELVLGSEGSLDDGVGHHHVQQIRKEIDNYRSDV